MDLATIIKAENSGNLHVFIAGTSRGAISAVANNALAAAVGLSSPVTRSSRGGSPIGSANLPVDTVNRPTHILIHQNDGCSATAPANSRTLFSDLQNAGIDVAGDEVTGGFRDTARDAPCKAFDYHGFTGIETCAVKKHTSWGDQFLASLPANARPQGTDATHTFAAGTNGNTFSVGATDADADPLTYAVPYDESALGGTVTITQNGQVTYDAPALAGITDKFVFVVTDGNGGVGIGMVTINLTS